MLDPWIIEQIRRREQEERSRPQPALEMPVPEDMPWPADENSIGSEKGTERGVVIISI